jgi:hypothetical protein
VHPQFGVFESTTYNLVGDVNAPMVRLPPLAINNLTGFEPAVLSTIKKLQEFWDCIDQPPLFVAPPFKYIPASPPVDTKHNILNPSDDVFNTILGEQI